MMITNIGLSLKEFYKMDGKMKEGEQKIHRVNLCIHDKFVRNVKLLLARVIGQ